MSMFKESSTSSIESSVCKSSFIVMFSPFSKMFTEGDSSFIKTISSSSSIVVSSIESKVFSATLSCVVINSSFSTS